MAVVKIRSSASATFLELTVNLITVFNTCEPKMCLSNSTAVLAACEFNTFNTSLSFQTRYNSSVKMQNDQNQNFGQMGRASGVGYV